MINFNEKHTRNYIDFLISFNRNICIKLHVMQIDSGWEVQMTYSIKEVLLCRYQYLIILIQTFVCLSRFVFHIFKSILCPDKACIVLMTLKITFGISVYHSPYNGMTHLIIISIHSL